MSGRAIIWELYQLTRPPLCVRYRETNDHSNDDLGFLDRVDFDGSFNG